MMVQSKHHKWRLISIVAHKIIGRRTKRPIGDSLHWYVCTSKSSIKKMNFVVWLRKLNTYNFRIRGTTEVFICLKPFCKIKIRFGKAITKFCKWTSQCRLQYSALFSSLSSFFWVIFCRSYFTYWQWRNTIILPHFSSIFFFFGNMFV